jgi:alkanesulfonate monooxygenase SsuD/methylene tetrahydromethanopterin reductase-like flavin-dependent oxidoreductase (luciferase family)
MARAQHTQGTATLVQAMDLAFGVALSTSARPGADPVADARRIEELGFDLLTVSDHLHGGQPSFETWTLLTWVAANTSNVRLAPTVLGLPYRAPAVIAKMAEALDRLSDGRLILGLGGGGSNEEFRAFGLPVRSPREKVKGLEDGIRIIRGMWSTEEGFTYRGPVYAVEEARIQPKPPQSIPIWTGSYGPRSLEVTGRLADGWNPSMVFAPPEVVSAMPRRVLRAAEEAGRDPADITCAYNVSVFVDEHVKPTTKMVAGGPDQVVERLAEFVRLGFTTLIFWARGSAEGRERLAREVVPILRELTA